MNQLQKVLRQIDDALGCYDRMFKKAGGDFYKLDDADLLELHTTVAAAVESLAPPNSVYHHNAEVARGAALHGQSYLLAGVLRALRTAYLGGYLATISDLVRADLFDDFLEMASHLLDCGYKDPAAALAGGGVLEEHLRKLCQWRSIQTVTEDKPKPASRMNDELAAAGACGRLDAKSVTAWLDLRNRAAHAKYDEYTAEQVRLMVHGVRDFIARTLSGPAG